MFLDGDIQNLWPTEADVLKDLYDRGVSKKWGYRSAPDGSHEAFERHTHESESDGIYLLFSLQKYTDPVFRTIEEVGGRGHTRVFNATLEKTVDPMSLESQRAARNILNRFLDRGRMLDAMQYLAGQPLEFRPTYAFAFVVQSAKALLALANGDFERALALRRAIEDKGTIRFVRERL